MMQKLRFLPDRPTHIYNPNFKQMRATYGGDVWIHLRSFEKQLFEQISHSHFKHKGKWLTQCLDYATMIPIVTLAKNPLWIPKPMILHERTTIYDEMMKKQRDEIIIRILSRFC